MHRDSPVAVVLDEYGDVVSSLGLDAKFPQVRWRSVREHLEGPELTSALFAASAVVLTPGRTQFSARLFDQLPALRLLVTTGTSNPAIDLDAATAHQVTVCGTTAPPACGGNYVAELAWALILCLARSIPGEVQGLRDGG
jgi:lactate dehydrogenase-like 2-hydroxyacid dehydrogenase